MADIFAKEKRKMNSYKKMLIIAIIQWFITMILQMDRLFFTYKSETGYMLVTKIAYLFLLMVGWCFVENVRINIKAGNKSYKRGMEIFLFYFVIMMLLLLILWPGTWSLDDIQVLKSIDKYKKWGAWQHFLSGLYLAVLLQVLPFPGGAILLQNVLVSICVAVVVTKLEIIYDLKRIKIGWIDKLVKVFPFLLPPVLMHQFSGYRMGLYIYLELVMIVFLIEAIKCKKQWSIGYTFLFGFLAVMVSTWRTESFLYAPGVCLLVIFMDKDVLSVKRKVMTLLLIVIGFLGINKFQNWSLGNSNYKVISLITPSTALVRAADTSLDAELLKNIDKVTKLKVIYENPAMSGTEMYWSTDVIRKGYTADDYEKYVAAVVKLSLKYPGVVVKERTDMFKSGMSGLAYSNVMSSASLFDKGNDSTTAVIFQKKNWLIKRPVFEKIRKHFIYFLGMKKWDGKENRLLQMIIWNSFVPTIGLLGAWVITVCKKQWKMALIVSMIIIKIPIVWLTEPSPWSMYLLTFYLLGYVYLVYGIYKFFMRRNINESGDKQTFENHASIV